MLLVEPIFVVSSESIQDTTSRLGNLDWTLPIAHIRIKDYEYSETVQITTATARLIH